MTKHISHTCDRRSCRPPRYLSGSTHSHTSKRCLATVLRVSCSITTGHYVLNKDVDPKRLGSENNLIYIFGPRAYTMTHEFPCCIPYPVSCNLIPFPTGNLFLYLVSCILYPVPYPELRILYPVSCIPYPIRYPISCMIILYLVSCILYPVSRILSGILYPV